MYKVKHDDGQVQVLNDSDTALFVLRNENWIVWKKSDGATTVTQAAIVGKLSDEELLKALATVVKLG